MANNFKLVGMPVWDNNILSPDNGSPSDMIFTYYGDKKLTQEDLAALRRTVSQAKFKRKYEENMRRKNADRVAQGHESAGVLSHMLVGGALGGLSAAVIKKLMNKGKPIDQKEMNQALGVGITVGALAVPGIPNLLGMIMGSRKDKLLESHVDYISGNNAWKNYLIPGYAGYRDTIRRRLVKEMIGE